MIFNKKEVNFKFTFIYIKGQNTVYMFFFDFIPSFTELRKSA